MASRALPFAEPLPLRRAPALTVIEGGAAWTVARYGEDRKPNWLAIGGIALGHLAVAALLLATGTVKLRAAEKPVFVQMIREDVAPSPPEQRDIPLEPVEAQVYVPPVEIDVPVLRASPVAVTALPPPPAPAAAPPSVATTAGPPVAALVIPPDGFADQLDNPAPRYPPMSKRNHEQGTVIVRVLVAPDGAPQDMHIATASRFKRLDDAALETLRRWKFLPAKQAGRPVAAWVLVPITFALDA